MRITAILPTYNESKNLPALIEQLLGLPLTLSVLVVDDNSPDGTGRVADELADRYPDRVSVLHRSGKLGLGTAYLEGFRIAFERGAEAVAQMDADFSHDPARLVDMAAALESADVVLGSRYVEGGSVDERWPIWRRALSGFGNRYARTILGLELRDVTTGFRLWRREALEQLPLDRIRSTGYIFLVEMAYLAHCMGYRFAQVPIHFTDRRWGTSKMSLSIQFEAALRVWEVRWTNRHLRR